MIYFKVEDVYVLCFRFISARTSGVGQSVLKSILIDLGGYNEHSY